MKGIFGAIKSKIDDIMKPKVTRAWFGKPEDNPFVEKKKVAGPPFEPTPTPREVTPKFGSVETAIRKGFEEYGNPPAATLSGEFAKQAETYPIFKKYPYLLPAISINETSGGKNVTYPNNLMNWGIYNDFNPKTPAESIERAASGIGKRTPYYEGFRNTGNLRDFVYTYAPPTENDSERYIQNLEKLMSLFAKYQE